MTDKQRTLTYRRADWFVATAPVTLEQLLRNALRRLATVTSTRIQRADDSVVEIAHRRLNGVEPLYLHVCVHTPGEGASAIPSGDAVEEVDLEVVPAPDGADFLDGDAMLLVHGNDVALCTSNMHEAAVVKYLRDLIEQSNQGRDFHSFELLKVANRDVLARLLAGGVRKITLDVHAFQETLERASHRHRGVFEAVRDGASEVFNALISRDEPAEEVMARSNLQAAVVISADMRQHNGAEVVAGEVAQNVLDSFESGYQIETVSGIKITPEEVAVRERFSFPADGKTVRYRAVWRRLAEFYNSIRAEGLNAE